MAKILRLTFCGLLIGLLVSCATAPSTTATAARPGRIQKVRTTAYSHNEGGSGTRNAIGGRLSSAGLRSASSDWSRYPLGTRFRVVSTGEEYVIDDYGWALVGTNTIDLYKSSRGEMRRWGVKNVEIEVLHWGSEEESLKVLKPRRGVAKVRRMIASLEKKQQARAMPGATGPGAL